MKIPKTLRLHVDTEFTDFKNRDLISIGVVADNGDEFYGENVDFIQAWSSEWVKTNIYPLLNHDKHGMKRVELSARLWTWIDELPCDFVIITVDYDGDYELLYDLFGEEIHPKMIEWQNLKVIVYKACDEQVKAMGGTDTDYQNLVRKIIANFELEFMSHFLQTKEIQHHALSDARANKRAWDFVVDRFGFI